MLMSGWDLEEKCRKSSHQVLGLFDGMKQSSADCFKDFFAACFDIYPAGTLSPVSHHGWLTYRVTKLKGWTCWLKFHGPSDAVNQCPVLGVSPYRRPQASRLLDPMVLQGYELDHIDDALRTLPRGVGHVTFPVHCTMARVGHSAIIRLLQVGASRVGRGRVVDLLLQADERFTLTVWGEAMEGDDEWMFKTPELQG
eukprot:747625-Hanusia_phi.AAC.3